MRSMRAAASVTSRRTPPPPFPQVAVRHQRLHLRRHGLGRVHEAHAGAERGRDRRPQQRVVRAPQDQRVHAAAGERLEVQGGDLAGDGVVPPPLLGERHEQRARPCHDLDVGPERTQRPPVGAGGDRGLGADDADPAPGCGERGAGARRDDTDHRDLHRLLERRQRRRGNRVARDHEQLGVVPGEEAGRPHRVADHGLGRFRAVREARGVAEVDEALGRQTPLQGGEHRQAADPRVEDRDRPRVGHGATSSGLGASGRERSRWPSVATCCPPKSSWTRRTAGQFATTLFTVA